MDNAKENELLPKEVGLAIQTNNVRYGIILLNHKKVSLPRF